MCLLSENLSDHSVFRRNVSLTIPARKRLNFPINMTSQTERFLIWRWTFYKEELEPILSETLESLAHHTTNIRETLCYEFSKAWNDVPTYWNKLREAVDGTSWKIYTSLIILLLLIISTQRWSKKHENHKKVHHPKPAGLARRHSLRSDELYARAIDMAKMAYESAMAERLITLVSENKLDVSRIIPGHKLSIFLAACLSGNSSIICYLLTKGVNVAQSSAEGDPPMYLATYGILNSAHPDLTILAELVQHGADVNAKNTRGYTPLHRAASRGNMEVIKYLLDLGADPYIRNNTGTYPLDSAVNAGHLEAGEILQIELADRNVWDIVDPYTPPRIRLGLQSPDKRSLMESTKSRSTPAIFRRHEQ